MTMTHGFHAAIPARPGQGDALVALLLDAPSLSTEDCIVFLVGRSASNPDLVFVTEGWVNEEAHGRFFNSEVAKAFTARVQELVGGESQYADEVPVGGKAAI
ncbi:putative quinol monooxygenase [Devosia sp. CN2-171]|uniref:putative quinol monooxygenase n=1 Tax=Devosia sp. CN2-171 TaxID=3400909 RepID=UPI003BF7805B